MKVYIVSYHFRSTEVLAVFQSKQAADEYRLRLAGDEEFLAEEQRGKYGSTFAARRAADEVGTILMEAEEVRDAG